MMPKRRITHSEFTQLKAMDMGKRIRYLREQMDRLYGKNSFATTELAKKLGVTSQSLTAIERGVSQNPSFKAIHLLSKEFNVPIDVFTDDYYLCEKPQLFTIGFEDGSIVEENNEDIAESFDSPKFKAGVISYQWFENGDIQINLREESTNFVDEASYVQFLARIYSELFLFNTRSNLNNPQYLKSNENPYNRILQQYLNPSKDPEFLPRGKKENWDKCFKQFTKISLREDNNEE